MRIINVVKLNILFILASVFLIVVAFFYVSSVYNNRLEEQSQKVIIDVKIMAIGLEGEMIKLLTSSLEDVGTIHYESIKKRLIGFKNIDEDIVFTYLMSKKDDKIFFMADSEPVDSEDYSYPGQHFIEADDQIYQSFESNEIIITEPTTDRWGTWISVLTPIKNENNQIIAVLGVDYSAQSWNDHAVYDSIFAGILSLIVIFVVFLFYLLIRFLIKIKKEEIKTKEKEKRFEELIRQSKTFVWEVDKQLSYTYASSNVKDIIGYRPEDLVGKKTVFDLHPKEGLEDFKNSVWSVIEKKQKIFDLENPLVNKKGETIWVLSSGVPVLNKKGGLIGYRGFDIDITERKKSQEDLEKSNKIMVNRELKMIELKKRIKELQEKLNKKI